MITAAAMAIWKLSFSSKTIHPSERYFGNPITRPVVLRAEKKRARISPAQLKNSPRYRKALFGFFQCDSCLGFADGKLILGADL
jgi:hypothetical protein